MPLIRRYVPTGAASIRKRVEGEDIDSHCGDCLENA